jgi:hypothetical protein
MDRDVELVTDDEKIAHMLAFTSWQFTSELWVLSACKQVRYVKANLGSLQQTTVDMRTRWAPLKKDYEQIRIPLAKFRAAASDANDTDVARPVVPGNRGAGWQLTADTTVWREDLAEKLREAIRVLPDPA